MYAPLGLASETYGVRYPYLEGGGLKYTAWLCKSLQKRAAARAITDIWVWEQPRGLFVTTLFYDHFLCALSTHVHRQA